MHGSFQQAIRESFNLLHVSKLFLTLLKILLSLCRCGYQAGSRQS
jgi:hypothetical protein